MEVRSFFWIVLSFFCIFVPMKIFSELSVNHFDRSYWFAFLCLIALMSTIVCGTRIKTKGDIVPSLNTGLGCFGFLIASLFLWNSYTFSVSIPVEGLNVSYKIMSVISIFVAVVFAIVSYSHFKRENLFKKFSFFRLFVFLPSVYFLISLTFSLVLATTPDPYSMAAQSAILIFLVYFSLVFVKKDTKINVKKRLFTFSSLSFVISSLAYIPFLIKNSFVFASADTSMSLSYLLISLYALFFCLQIAKDSEYSKQGSLSQ
ncbi:MAG: hypothetical protein LBP36_03955 [Oscillospiraceae bacterium]|nr:hypothetical protein [Oscillospiraceae bacterium]